MPIYEYKCDTCATTKAIERSIHSEASNPLCDDCKQVMNRIYSTPGISFTGTGWGGSYGQKR